MPYRPLSVTARVALVATVALGAAIFAGPRVARSLAPPAVSSKATALANLTLKDTAGASRRLGSLRTDKTKAIVVYVFGADCPVTKLYLPRLSELARRYESRGAVFVAINCNAHETAADSARAVSDAKILFPVLLDPSQQAADLLQITHTGEAMVLDATGAVRFRGAIDDQYKLVGRRPAPTRRYLTDALDAVLARRAVATPSAPVAGCALDRMTAGERAAQAQKAPSAPVIDPAAGAEPPVMSADDAAPMVGKVNYAQHVAPILRSKCESCHRPGQIAPFALQTYADAKRWSATIAETVKDKRMPPWHADPHVGAFANDRGLSVTQRAQLLAWVAQGSPQGNPKLTPAPAVFPDKWTIGKPDVVLTMPEPYKVAATGTLAYQWFRIPTNFTTDRWIQAAEVKPGVRGVVHHVLVFVDDKKSPNRPNGIDGQLAAFVPGDVPTTFPAGVAKKIPAGSDLVLQVHYTPTGKEVSDQTSVGLIFAREAPTRVAETVGIVQPKMRIPPNTKGFRVDRELTVPGDVTIYSLWPHMHLRGQAFAITAHYPDGRTEPLLSVPHYDFNWQTRYVLTEPRHLPRGTKLQVTAWYDNSKGNPYNPAPDRFVTWGEQTSDEMMIGYVDYVLDDPKKPDLTRLENLIGGLRDNRRQRQTSPARP